MWIKQKSIVPTVFLWEDICVSGHIWPQHMDMQTHGQLPLMQWLKVRVTPKASQSNGDIPEYAKYDATILAVLKMVYRGAAKGLKIRLDEGVQRRCSKSTTVRPFSVMPCCFCQKKYSWKNTFFLLLFFFITDFTFLVPCYSSGRMHSQGRVASRCLYSRCSSCWRSRHYSLVRVIRVFLWCRSDLSAE